MGFGHISIYCTSFIDTYSCRCFFQQAERLKHHHHQVLLRKLGRIDSESKASPVHSKSLPVRYILFLGIQWGCKVKIWKKLRGRSFLELPNLSWSNLPLPGSTGSSEGLVGSTPNFFGACRFFFFKQRRLHFGIFFFHLRLAIDPCWNLPGVVPGYENKQLYLEDEAVPPLKILGLTTTLWKTAVSPQGLEAVSWVHDELWSPVFSTNKHLEALGSGWKAATGEKFVEKVWSGAKPRFFSRFLCCLKKDSQELVKTPHGFLMRFQQGWEDFPAIVTWFTSRQKSWKKLVNTPSHLKGWRLWRTCSTCFRLNVLGGSGGHPSKVPDPHAMDFRPIWKGSHKPTLRGLTSHRLITTY